MAIVSIGFSASPAQLSFCANAGDCSKTQVCTAGEKRYISSQQLSEENLLLEVRKGRERLFCTQWVISPLCLVLLIVFVHPSSLACDVLLDFRYI